MSYMALYRKWRPDEFSEVKGQEHIVTTLKNQITHERIGHAYLFCGTRGTGKTTIAKLFAKAVNCENPAPDGSPCNCCAMCKAIAEGRSMNVMEIDAASNNGVDDIRELRDSVQYSPTEGKYKVYIVDEVHMLSTNAFNAFLKTLEEPPSYVIFILATTEAHKIPITILSRCQRYDFRRISLQTISHRLMELLEREKIEYEEKAIDYVAKVADGSMRDGLSLLDQCIAFHLGERLTYDKVLDVLGAVDIEIFDQMLSHVQQQDVLKAVNLIDDIMWQGRDLTQFVVDFTWYLRNILLVSSSEKAIDTVDVSSEQKALLVEKAKVIPMESLMRYIRIFSEVGASMKYASQKRVVMELAIIKLCKPQMETDMDSLLERIRQLEEKLEKGDFVVAASADVQNQEKVKEEQYQNPDIDFEQSVRESLPAATAEQIINVRDNWSMIRTKVSGLMQSHLDRAKLFVSDSGSELILSYDSQRDQGYRFFAKKDNLDELCNIVSQVAGADISIVCKASAERTDNSLYAYNMLADKINLNIEYEN